MSAKNGLLTQDSQTIVLHSSIVTEITEFQTWVKPYENKIKEIETGAKTLASQIKERSSDLNGQIKGFLLGKDITLPEKNPYLLQKDNKTILIPGEKDSIEMVLPEIITSEIVDFQSWSEPIQERIKGLQNQAKELNWTVREKSAELNGQIKGFLRGMEIDLEGKIYSITEDLQSVIISDKPKE